MRTTLIALSCALLCHEVCAQVSNSKSSHDQFSKVMNPTALIGSTHTSYDELSESNAESDLLNQARFWQSKKRDDLAEETLEKLLHINPNHIQGLALISQIQYRRGVSKFSQTLTRLKKIAPKHPVIIQINLQQRISEDDQSALRDIRKLSKEGKKEHAAEKMRTLYPTIFPNNDIAVEYYLMLGATNKGWEEARVAFKKMALDNPDDISFQLVLLDHVLSRNPNDLASIKATMRLAGSPTNDKSARSLLRKTLFRLDNDATTGRLIEKYLQIEPTDSSMKDKLIRIQNMLIEIKKLHADSGWQAMQQGLALLDKNNTPQAMQYFENALALGHDTSLTHGNIGLAQMRLGQQDAAIASFKVAQRLAINDADEKKKWQILQKTAQYWLIVKQAVGENSAQNSSKAESLLNEAISLLPKESGAYLALARIYIAQRRFVDAYNKISFVMRIAPNEDAALIEMINLYIISGQESKAHAFEANIPKQRHSRIKNDIAKIRAQFLSHQAEELLSSNSEYDIRHAVTLLEEATKLDSQNPWLFFSLAKQYATAGEYERGHNLFLPLLKIDQPDAQVLHAAALFEGLNQNFPVALDLLEKIPDQERTTAMVRLQRKLWIDAQRLHAESLTSSQNSVPAFEKMLILEKSIDDDPDLVLALAESWVNLGQYKEALRFVKTTIPNIHTMDIDWQLRWAELQERAAQYDALRTLLLHIVAKPKLESRQLLIVKRLQNALQFYESDTALKSGQWQTALKALEGLNSDDPKILQQQSKILRESRQWEQAIQVQEYWIKVAPNDRDAQLEHIDTLIATGHKERAITQIYAHLKSKEKLGRDPTYLSALANRLISFGDYKQAQQMINLALELHPSQIEALEINSQIAIKQGNYKAASINLQNSFSARMKLTRQEGAKIDLSPMQSLLSQQSPAYLPNRLANLFDLENTWISDAVDMRMRTGNSGTSQLSAQESVSEWKSPKDFLGQIFLRADYVQLNAGEVERNLSTFGAQLLAPSIGQRIQFAKGVALTAGFIRNDLRADLGITPLGFAIPTIVGGMHTTGDLNQMSWSLEASRRPVVASLLSQAGTQDLVTGTTWGGVTANGLRLGLSYDQGNTWGFWSNLGLHRLMGKNVTSNDRLQVMAGTIYRPINQENQLLAIGLTAMHWNHRENLGEYTLGHGGYYSPATFNSLSLPITYALRFSRLSLALRGAIGLSRSSQKDSPYYPDNPELQARATEYFLAGKSENPIYRGNDSARSISYGISANIEYQATAKLFLGVRVQIDRSADYSPNQYLIYLRYAFDHPAAQTVPLIPQPITPSSHF